MNGDDPLARLAQLTGGAPEPETEEEAQIAADIKSVLDLAAEITDNNPWEMQALIALCAEELRMGIREDNEEEEE